MRLPHFCVLVLTAILSLQSCKSDPNGPGESVMLASIYDSSLVDVTGNWQFVTVPAGNVTLAISSGLVRCFEGRVPKHSGTFDRTFDRHVIVKKNGVERAGRIYGINVDEEQWGLAVLSQDSISFGPCDEDPKRAGVTGIYVRLK